MTGVMFGQFQREMQVKVAIIPAFITTCCEKENLEPSPQAQVPKRNARNGSCYTSEICRQSTYLRSIITPDRTTWFIRSRNERSRMGHRALVKDDELWSCELGSVGLYSSTDGHITHRPTTGKDRDEKSSGAARLRGTVTIGGERQAKSGSPWCQCWLVYPLAARQ
ncbi:hypothetical protein J6590_066601 [Homalodisca vitripennis]|nr:hypothetical protein J6590_066601 [Homalodisca vitripennis]